MALAMTSLNDRAAAAPKEVAAVEQISSRAPSNSREICRLRPPGSVPTVPLIMVTSDRISTFAPKAGKKSKAGSVPEGDLVR